MTDEPINSGPTPLSQFPVQGVDPFEADPFYDGQLPPDPLLESGTFIDVVEEGGEEKVMQTNLDSESAAAGTTTATADAEDSVAADVTPLSQRPAKKLPEELVERPDWLPEDWKMEVKVRTSGATAGTADRYYFSPSGARLRSKKEVLHFLETGSKVKKRKQKTEDGASVSDNPSGRKQKKPKVDVRNFAKLKGFNFNGPPQSVEYISTGDGDWDASVDNKILPESKKAEWDKVFSHLTQLDSSTGAA